MKNYIVLLLLIVFSVSCRSTKKIGNVIAPRDSTTLIINKPDSDSLAFVNSTLEDFRKNYIDFKTFSAKIKADVEDSKGKHPDLSAVVRIIKDSSIWISVSATFLGIEVYRILIEKDKVILLNKQDKEVQYRTMDYLQEVTQIPFDYKTVENLLVGNPVFFSDSILSIRKNEDKISILSIGDFFKHLLTVNALNKRMLHSKLDDVDIYRNRTADISYSDYEMIGEAGFPTTRNIVISEKSKIIIALRYKQVEFNKELSVSFPIPRNYKSK